MCQTKCKQLARLQGYRVCRSLKSSCPHLRPAPNLAASGCTHLSSSDHLSSFGLVETVVWSPPGNWDVEMPQDAYKIKHDNNTYPQVKPFSAHLEHIAGKKEKRKTANLTIQLQINLCKTVIRSTCVVNIPCTICSK